MGLASDPFLWHDINALQTGRPSPKSKSSDVRKNKTENTMAEQPNLLALKQWALRKKYESIETEMAAWQALTVANQPLEKHNSQVLRVSTGLSGMIEIVRAEVDKLQQQSPDPGVFFQQVRRAEFLILEVHRTWQYFRQKLTTRQAPPFNALLESLDEFVWGCYKPVRDIATDPRKNPPGPPLIAPNAVREPPLTFFNSNWSPAASAREETLPLEKTVDSSEGRYAQEGKLADKRLVSLLIPVIGLPWSDVTFLPEALLLAHETAHLLDFDLKLADEIESKLKTVTPKIPAKRFKQYWQPWSAEVFADLYGVLCVGPAFVGALMTLVAGSPGAVLSTPDPSNSYPTPHLRVLLALSGLESIGFGSEATKLAQGWNQLYGEPVAGQPNTYQIKDFALSECAADIPAVVKALLDSPFEALDRRTFKDVDKVRWSALDQQAALKIRDSLLQPGLSLDSGKPSVLIAGAQLAFQQNPQALLSSAVPTTRTKTQTDLIAKILASRVSGTRAATTRPTSAAPLQTNADRDTGKALAEALLAEFDKTAPS